MPASRRIEPAVAGTWYPADPGALRSQVDDLLRSAAATGKRATARGLIAPHAGFAYSGGVAAAAFAGAAGLRAKRVMLIGPSHHHAFDGAAIPESASYVTPLGEIPFDLEALGDLARRPGIAVTDRPFAPEHSLEAELPFLQRTLPDGWQLVPVLTGSGARADSVSAIADALRPHLSPETLIVASSDFTHYGRCFDYLPFTHDVPEQIRDLDLGAVDLLLAGDRDGFLRYVERTGATICGTHAIDILLRLLPTATTADLSAYDTSGRMTGAWDPSVSYAGIVFAEAARGLDA